MSDYQTHEAVLVVVMAILLALGMIAVAAPVAATETNTDVIWEDDAGPMEASPTVAGDYVAFYDYDGDALVFQHQNDSSDAQYDGKYNFLPPREVTNQFGPTSGSALGHTDVVYVPTDAGFVAVRPSDNYQDQTAKVSVEGVPTSHVRFDEGDASTTADDRVFVASYNESAGDAYVTAVNTENMTVAWQASSAETALPNAPATGLTVGADNLYVTTENSITALAKNGENASSSESSNPGNGNDKTPGNGNGVGPGNNNGNGNGAGPGNNNGNGNGPENSNGQGTPAMVTGESTGFVAWNATFDGDADSNIPTVASDTVYVSGNGIVYAFDAATGSEQWTFSQADDFGQPALSTDGSSVFVAGSMGENASVFSLAASDGTEEWQTTPVESDGDAQPTVANGNVYFDYGGHLYAYDEADGSAVWMHREDDTPITATTVAVNDDGRLFSVDRNAVYAIEDP